MPYIGVCNGQEVLPIDVDSGNNIKCPKCGGTMSVRESHWNKGQRVPRHFFHVTSNSPCDTELEEPTNQNKNAINPSGATTIGEHENKGGFAGEAESETHAKMKMLAHNELQSQTPDTATVECETGIGQRIADVCVTFSTPQFPLGNGIVVEAQYKHKDKDYASVTREFLSHGYSIYWMYLSDIDDDNTVSFTDKRFHKVWPESVPRKKQWTGQSKGTELMDQWKPTKYPISGNIPNEYFIDQSLTMNHPSDFQETDVSFLGKAWIHSKGRYPAWFEIHDTSTQYYLLTFVERDRKKDTQEHNSVCITKESIDVLREFVSDVRYSNPFQTNNVNSWVTVASINFIQTELGDGWLSLGKTSTGPKIVLGRKANDGSTYTITTDWRKGDVYRIDDNLLPLVYQSTRKTENAPFFLGKNK